MAMAPHWLDDVFEDGPANAKAKFQNHPKLAEAFREAETAYRDAEKAHKDNPGMVGGVPKQSARARFLEVLNG